MSTAQNRKGNKKVNDRQKNVERIGSKKCLLSEQERERLATVLKQAAERLPHRQQQLGPGFESLGLVFLFIDDVHGTVLQLIPHKSSPLVIFSEPLEEEKSNDSAL